MIVLFLFRNNHLNVVEFLVYGKHCNLEAKDDDGWTVIHWASRYVYQQCYYSTTPTKTTVIRYKCYLESDSQPLKCPIVYLTL